MAESVSGGGFLDHCDDGSEVADREKASIFGEFAGSHAVWSANGCKPKASRRSTEAAASALETCSRGVAGGALRGASVLGTAGAVHIGPATCACVSGRGVALAAPSLPLAVGAVGRPDVFCANGVGASWEAAEGGSVVSGDTIVRAPSPNACLCTASAASGSLTDASGSDSTAAGAPAVDAATSFPSDVASPSAKQTRPVFAGHTSIDEACRLNRECSADPSSKCPNPAVEESNTCIGHDATSSRAPYDSGGSLGACQMAEKRLCSFPEWLCSLTASKEGAPKGAAPEEARACAQGEEAEYAAAAPAAAAGAASDISASQQGVASSPFLADMPALKAELGLVHVAAESVAAEVEDACSLKESHVSCSDSRSALGQSLNEADQVSDLHSGASRARNLLQQLKERAAGAARLPCLSVPAADLSLLWKATSFERQDTEDFQRQEGSTVPVAATTRQEVFQAQESHPCGVAAAAALAAAAAARAQRAMEPQLRTVWNTLRKTVADSSQSSIQAVQRAAGSAISATGAGDRALGVLAFPLFSACTTPPAGGQGNGETASQGGEGSDAGEYAGESSERSIKVDGNASEEMASAEQVNDADATSQGLLGGLHRRQQVIAEELRKRSTNLLQHSVALGASSTLSEARYHLAEIVDTGGPEVSGMWAGVKVGLGIATLASGHLLLGGAMVAMATGSLGSVALWCRHRHEVYEMMRGDTPSPSEQQATSGESGGNVLPLGSLTPTGSLPCGPEMLLPGSIASLGASTPEGAWCADEATAGLVRDGLEQAL